MLSLSGTSFHEGAFLLKDTGIIPRKVGALGFQLDFLVCVVECAKKQLLLFMLITFSKGTHETFNRLDVIFSNAGIRQRRHRFQV